MSALEENGKSEYKTVKKWGFGGGSESSGAGPRSLRGEARKRGARNTILLLIEEKFLQIEPVKHR